MSLVRGHFITVFRYVKDAEQLFAFSVGTQEKLGLLEVLLAKECEMCSLTGTHTADCLVYVSWTVLRRWTT